MNLLLKTEKLAAKSWIGAHYGPTGFDKFIRSAQSHAASAHEKC